MNRREFITLLGGAAASWPLAARAQRNAPPRVGLLWVASERVVKPYENSIRAGFRELGYIEGRNFVLDVRYGNGDVDRLPGLIDDLIALRSDVLSGNNQSAALMKAKTSTIPIVLNWSYDPVEIGLVQSLSRPGGNVTGVATLYEDLLTKHIELAGELIASMSRIGFINDATDPSAERFNAIAEKAARVKGVALTQMAVRDHESVEAVFAKFETNKPDVLIVGLSGGLFNLRDPIAEGARNFRIPVIYSFEGFVEAGGLMSYGPNYHSMFRRSTIFIDKILKGTKPADLPIEQPTLFELVINLKAAQPIGLTIPQLFLMRADRVIE
jgi:ABC-type uncharacterized transport system substrate-binding protein